MARKVKIKDTDYLFLSAYIHARESRLVGKERLERMLEAKSPQDAFKVLEECGWAPQGGADAAQLDQILADKREEAFSDMRNLAPDPKIVDLFRVKYDYHNAKVLIKSHAKGITGDELLLGAGRISPKKLIEAVLEENYKDLPQVFADAYIDAADTLSRTADPQISDFILDRAFFKEFLQTAAETGSAFLAGYVKLSADTANLRSVVRAVRMKKDSAFLKMALVPGGTITPEEILAAFESAEAVLALFRKTDMRKAVDAAETAMKGGRLTEFEKLGDDLLAAYLSEARMAGFSEKPLVRYLCAVEAEINAIRIIMAGQFSGLSGDTIKERLREEI